MQCLHEQLLPQPMAYLPRWHVHSLANVAAQGLSTGNRLRHQKQGTHADRQLPATAQQHTRYILITPEQSHQMLQVSCSVSVPALHSKLRSTAMFIAA